MSCIHELGIPRIIAIKTFIFTGIQGSSAEGAIDTRQSILLQRKLPPQSNSKKQTMFQQQPIRSGSWRMETFIYNSLSVRAHGEWKPLFTTAYPFGLMENGNLYFQQPIRSGSWRMETFTFSNSLSVRAHGEWKPLLSATAYPFGLMENGNLYFQQQPIRSGSWRMETFIFSNSLSVRAQGEWKLLFSTAYLFRLMENRTSYKA
ncbi:hypothetical protein V6N11_037712 [Hibiscus sabdariffa]|uniref:Uncharacterized protein n=1 Tax=Hibiscus sabdariffa TaxID=183260 RepID=A0ABR2PC61_9ROSI